MKFAIAMTIVFLATNAYAGWKPEMKSISVYSTISEADMVLKAEALIPSIVNFTNKEIRRIARYARCDVRPRNIKLGSMSVKKYYKSYDNVTLEPKWQGNISYTLLRCRDND